MNLKYPFIAIIMISLFASCTGIPKNATAVKNFEVEKIEFGFRPTVKDRRPIVGNHAEYPHLHVFNGMGARGILNGNYFAKELFEHIEYGKPIHPEVDLKRFEV